MTYERIIPCDHCQTEGRIYRGQHDDERDYGPCPFCEGTGGEIISTEPVTLDDFQCPDCAASLPLLFPCHAQGCPIPKSR